MEHFQRPGQSAIDHHDPRLHRRGLHSRPGTFINKWQTPHHQFGKPTGLSIGNDGLSDTHYYEVLIYRPDGQLIEGLRTANEPGEFGLVTHAVQDSAQ